MATVQELLDVVKQIGPAIDAFEARITALLAQVGQVPPEVQAGIDEALATLKADLADAADGVDEAAAPAPPANP